MSPKYVAPLLIVYGLALASSAAEPVGDAWWPQFRGPNASGIAESGEYPVVFGRSNYLLWKTPLPPGVSSPCVWGHRIFVTCFDAERKKLEVVCIDRGDGKILWRQTAPTEKIEKFHPAGSPVSSTPVTDGERVYVYFGSYGLLCFDMEGNELWNKPMPIPITQWGTGTSPVLAADKLILIRDQYSGWGAEKRSAYVLALDPKDGTTIWKTERPAEPSWSTPIVRPIGGSEELVVFGRKRLIAYDLRDGAERWRVDGLPLDAVGVPVTGSGLIFVAGTEIGGDPERPIAIPAFADIVKRFDKDKDGKISQNEAPRQISLDPRTRSGAEVMSLHSWFWQVDKDKDGLASREEWIEASEVTSKRFTKYRDAAVAIRPGGSGDVTETHVAWRVSRGVPDSPSPLYHEDRLYLVKTGGIVSCLDAKTGEQRFRSRLGSGGPYSSSPVVANSNVYIASERGVIVVFKAGDKPEVLAKNDLGERIMATPAFVDGKIYVRTDEHLYAFGK